MKNPTFLKITLVLFLLLQNLGAISQTYKPFSLREKVDIRGKMIVAGNNILGVDNLPNNDNTLANQSVSMKYIDIDGDSSTFSSSSANLVVPNQKNGSPTTCYRVAYAALYWGAMLQNGSRTEIDKVKLKVPGETSYRDIDGEVIYDAVVAPIIPDSNKPYACYADVTSLLQGLTTLQGTYTVGNVIANEGSNGSTGLSAGWTLLVVYEDPNLQMKSFNVFDGFSHIYKDHAEVIPVTGFRTPPTGVVDIQFAYAALDGDKPQSATKLEFGNHQVVTPFRPANNFFSSTIENTNGVSTPRNPSGTNTLGYDTGVLEVKDANPEYINNNQTSTSFTLQVAPGQADPIFAFFTAYAVDEIAPDILLTKIVKNAQGVDIGGTNVTLGQNLFYEISYQNLGSDAVSNFTIKDVLPKNVIFNGAADVDLTNSGGATIQSYDAATRTIIFKIPNAAGTVGGAKYKIILKVQVVDDCNKLSDVCSNEIKNQAFANYRGVINPAIIDEGSFSSINSCNFGAATPTNFLVGLDCKYTKQYILCANSIVMSAANGYDSYSWSTSPTGTPVIGTNQTYTATKTGVYYVTSTTNSTCKSISETITVVPYGNTITNPVIPYAQAPYAGEVVKCESDGKLLPNLFICGANAPRLIKTGITDAISIIWEKLDEASCSAAVENCANESKSCKWTEVAKGPDYSAGVAGQFRLTIYYKGLCFSQFYFNVYVNPLNPTVTSKDITCKTLGEITVHDVPTSGYEFSLDGNGTGVYQSSNVFPNAAFPVVTVGYHNVYIRQVGVTNACIFQVLDVLIKERIYDVKTIITQPTCKVDKGSIRIQANNVLPQYYYSITQGGVTNEVGPLQTNDYTFANLNVGDYTVRVWTDDGCDFSKDEQIIAPPTLDASAQLTTPLTACSNGEITVTPIGGVGPFTYYINGTTNFQSSNLITVSNPLPTGGKYSIIVEDSNNCRATTSITVTAIPAPEYTVDTTDEKCYGDKNGTITFNVTNANGYTLSYSIDNGANFNATKVFSNLAPGPYSTQIKYTLGSAICYGPVKVVTIGGSSSELSAAAGVSEMSGCGPVGEETKGKIRITNPQGGTLPYTYSFDGGDTFITSNEAYVAPGTYTLYIKDAKGCIFPMEGIILEPKPTDPTFTLSPTVYNCDGTGSRTVTVTTSGTDSYAYTYLLDGKVNTNVPANVFVNIPTGEHTISVEYNLVSVPTYSNLLIENFGKDSFTYTDTKSPDGASPGINPNFCWERQIDATMCHKDRLFDNGEYTVTSSLRNNPYIGWHNPIDHTSGTRTGGRYLAVDAGTAIPNNAVLYRKTIKDIIPNQPIQVRFFATNLLKVGNKQPDASLTVELQNASGVPLSSQSTGKIPKTDGWVEINRTINPGSATTLDFVLRLELSQVDGIDFAVDDIEVYQLPKTCLTHKDFDFVVDTNKKFTAKVDNILNVKCKGANNGSFNIIAENFDPATGFFYSIDGAQNWLNSKISPVLVSGLAPNKYDVRIRYSLTSSACSETVPVSITEPASFIVNANATAATCTTGSTITVSSVGGTAPFSYILTDKNNPANVITFTSTGSASGILKDIPAGTYIVSGTDANSCTDANDADIVVTIPNGPTASIAQNTGLCFDSGAEITVDVTGGLAPYSYQVSYNSGTPSAFVSFTGNSFKYPVTATGTYDFTIIDKNNCKSAVESQKIEPKITAKAAILAGLSCAVAPASSDATIEVEISGGTSPYTYTVTDKATNIVLVNNGATVGPKFTYSTATAGIYVFAIKDKNDCLFTIEKEVNALVAVTAKATVKDVTCFGADNGSVTLEGLTGVAPFEFNFNGLGFSTTTTYSGLAGSVAGISYTYIVKDAKDCTKSYTITVKQPDDITLSANISTAYTCDNSATITASASGGNGSFTYTLYRDGNVVASNTTGIFSNLTVAGVYKVTATDAKACSKTVDAGIIDALNPPKGMTLTPSAVTCPGNTANVTITNVIDASGTLLPTAGLEYRIKSPAPYATTTYQTSNVFNGLAAGVTYTFEVRDTKKCVYEKDLKIDALPTILVTVKSQISISCLGSTDGSAIFTVSGMGNSTPYSYQVDTLPAVTGQTTPGTGTSFDIQVPNLGAGTHTIVVTNTGTTCSDSEEVTIAAPTAALALDLTVTTDVTCKGNGTATINVTANSGWGSYSYEVTRTAPTTGTAITQTNNLFTNLIAGDYSFTVTDLKGCQVSGTFTIKDKVLPTASIDVTSDYCAGGAGATIKVTPNAATNYTYTLGAIVQNNGTFSGLTPGDYTIRVTDTSTGCYIDLTVPTIVSPVTASTKLLADLDCDVTPASPDASIEVTINDGYPNYTYKVNKDIAAPFGGTVYLVAGNSFIYTATTAGTYYFEITDSKGCTTVVSRTINVKVDPTATTTPTNPTCFGSNNGSITVKVSLGLAPYTYEFSTTGLTGSFSSMTSNIKSGLGAGNYWFKVTDSKKCFVVVQETLTNPAELKATAEVTTPLSCGTTNAPQAATITVTVTSPGTPFLVPTLYRYTYTQGAKTVGPITSNTFTTSDPGEVSITVTDANGCTAPASVTIDNLTPPTALAFSAPDITCELSKQNTDLLVTVTGGALPLKYEITSYTAAVAPGTLVATNNANTYTFTDLVPGTYFFKVTDANNCTLTGQYKIDAVTPIQVSDKILKNVSCNGLSDGEVEFTISGNRALTYSSTLVGSVTGDISGVSIGDVITYSGLNALETYTFTVINNDTKCTATKVLTLSQPDAITALDAKASKVYCDQVETTIKVTASGGTTPLQYAVVKFGLTPGAADYNTTGLFTKDTSIDGLKYVVYVKDKNGNCSQNITLDVVKDDAPTIDPVTAPQCYSGSSFIITIVGATYNSTILYGLNGSYNTNKDKTINGPGTYILGIKDDNGCEVTTSVVVNDQLTLTVTPDKDVTCPTFPVTDTDAKFTLSASGGNNSYTYEYKLGLGGTYATILPVGNNVFETSTAGDYYFKVTSAGCEKESAVFKVTDPVNPTATATVTDLSCYQSKDGVVTIVPTSGVAPFTFSFNGSPFTANDTYSNLAASPVLGYPYSVRDSKGCEVTTGLAIVTEPLQILFTTTEVNMFCPGPTFGSVKVSTITNGVAPFTYELKNIGTGLKQTIPGLPGTAEYTFANLSFGEFELTVSDATGCSNVKKNIQILAPPNQLDIDLATPIDDCADGATIVVTVNPNPVPTTPLYQFGIYDLPIAPFSTSLLPPDVPNGLTHTFKNLTPGVVYTFVVYDPSTNCYYFEKASGAVAPLTNIGITATSIPVACKGSATGGVAISLTNTDATQVKYEIFKDQTTTSTGIAGTITMPTTVPVKVLGLATGTYYVKFTEVDGSSLGCTSSSAPFVVEESAVDLSVTASSPKNDNCKIDAGRVVAVPHGGTGPFLYQIVPDNGPIGYLLADDTQPTSASFESPKHDANIFNVEAGNYLVWIKDGNGCAASVPATVTVNADPTLVIDKLEVVDKCAKEGAFEVTVSMTTLGIAPYYISVNGGRFTEITDAIPFPYTISGLNSGPVNVIVKDFNDCEDADNITITPTPLATALVTKPLDCTVTGNAVADATITVTILKGTKGFKYQAYKDGTAVGGPVTLPAADNTFVYPVAKANFGTYKFAITDANNCPVETNEVVIDEIIPITVTPNLTQPLCNGGSNGAIELPAKGGKGKYTYTLQLTSSVPVGTIKSQGTPLFTSLIAGDYDYTITDELGCQLTGSLTLGQPALVAVGTPVITPLTCGPGNMGQAAEVELAGIGSGGTGSYLYSFNNSAFTKTTKYFVADTKADQLGIPYAIQDANGCEDSGTIDILKLSPPTDFDLKQDPVITCTTGSTTVTISNVENALGTVTTGLTYQIISPLSEAIDNGPNPVFTDLAPGDYVFQVKDAVGCVKQLPFEIKDVVKIDLIKQSTTGITCLGATDGKASFLVSGFAGTYHYILDAPATAVTNLTSSTIDLTGLTAGDHTIEVFDDATNCSKPILFNIAAPAAALVISKDVTDLGCTTTGAVTVTATFGWGNYTYKITQPDASILTTTDGVFDGLTQTGTYTIVVTDANGCKANDTFDLSIPTPPTATVDTSSDYCYDDTDFATLKVTASGGAGGFEYSIDGISWQPSNTFDKLTPGSYVIIVKDKFGCTVTVPSTTIKGQLFASAENKKDIFCTGTVPGTIKISAVGGYPDYSYTVKKDSDPISGPFPFGAGATSADYTVTGSGSYVFVVYDARNCSYTIAYTIVMDTPVAPTFSVTPKSPSCTTGQGNVNNGEILVALTGTTNDGPYSYTITRTNPTGYTSTQTDNGLFTGLTTGDYDVTVTSAKECSTPGTVTILDRAAVVADATAAPFTCSATNTLNKTIVTVTGSHGAGAESVTNFTYSENKINWDTTNTFNVIDNGFTQTLTYYVKDAYGCIDDVQVTVNPFPKLVSAVASFGTPIDCLNNKQEINVVINGGTYTPKAFTYNVYEDGVLITALPIPVTGNTFTYYADKVGSFYEVVIMDNNTGCSIKSNSNKVPVFDIAKVTASASANVDCNSNATGAIEINIRDYAGAYTYKVFNDTNPVEVFSGVGNTGTNPFVIPFGLVASNKYRVVVTESAYPSCSITSNDVQITEPPVLDITAMVVDVVNQNCKNTGAVITVDESTIVGGTRDYTYAFVTAGTTPTAGDYQGENAKTISTTAIAPLFDSYDVYVKDSKGCYLFKTVNISVDPMPAITKVSVDSQCTDANGYRIDVAANGVAPLQYSLDGVQFQDDSFFTVFKPGNYTVTVRDKNQCIATAMTPVTILDPLTLRAELTVVPKCEAADGTITLFATGGTVSTPSSYVYSKDGGTPQGSPVFNTLAPGTYKFVVKDIVTLCETEITARIETPTAVTGITLAETAVSCFGGNDGSIAVSLIGTNDNPIYLYSITAGPVLRPNQESTVFNDLPFGTYEVTVTSGRGCSNTATITVPQPNPIVVNAPTVSQFICTAGSNTINYATITVEPGSVSGGSGNYLIYQFLKGGVEVQKGASNVYTEYDLLGGDYAVNVFDDKNCQGAVTTAITIAPFASLDKVNFTVVTPITCDNPETLQVTVDTTGAVGQLEYTLSGVNGTVFTTQNNINGLFVGLGAGNYLVTIKNPTTGCIIKDVHYVFNPNTFVLKATPINGEICYGATDGSVRLTMVDNELQPANDAGSFDYTITNAAGTTITTGTSTGISMDITGLKSGIYMATAKLVNTPFCTVVTNFQIVQPAQELDVQAIGTPITCVSGNNDGVITVSAFGGWPGDYQFEVAGPISFAYSTQTVYPNLTAGLYTITVKDGKGCTDITTVELIVPKPITVVAQADVTMLPCNGDKSATITVGLPTGGQGSNYTYTLNYVSATGTVSSGPFASGIFTGLGAGRYTVTVKDGFSCEATTAEIIINEPSEVIASLEVASSQTCLTQASLKLSAVGGTGTYTYSTDASFVTILGSFSSTTAVTFSVPVGVYHYYVKDGNGCISIVSNDIEILSITPLTITLLNDKPYINCTGDNSGSISATAQGGLGNYVYTLFDSSNAILQGPQADGDFTGLVKGTYRVHVDSGDCQTDKTVVIDEAPVPLSAPYVTTDVTCFGANNGKIVINAVGGTGLISYAISPDLDQFSDVNVFDKLAAGRYQVIVQDVLGCYIKIDFEIFEPRPVTASEVPNSMLPEICAGDKNGAFSIEIKGGTEPYNVSLDDENGTYTQGAAGQTRFDFTGLVGGVHTVYIKDAAGCTAEFVENMPVAVILNPIATVSYDCVDNAPANRVVVEVDASNTNPVDIDYMLDASGVYQPSNIFVNVAPGKHSVTARHTNGCEMATAEFTIVAVEPLTIMETVGQQEMNIISVTAAGGTPAYQYSFNGEPFTSSNKFKIYKSGDYKVIVRDQNGCEASIVIPATYFDICLDNYFTPNGDGVYDQWGPGCTNIYDKLTFDIFDRYGRVIAKYHYGQKWDGRYNGSELPSGDYWYVLKLNDPKDPREFVGHFTLYR